MSSQISRTTFGLSRSAGRVLNLQRGGQTRQCSQCHSVKEWKENHGSWSRMATTMTPARQSGIAGGYCQQVRTCSQCHSVKDWKENHGAWSRVAAATVSSPAGQSRACSQCHSVKEWKENHGTWSRAGPVAVSPSTPTSGVQVQRRTYATEGKSLADQKIEEITELFNTAKDEFELAYEETEKQTIYAENDRAAAQEEFDNMKEAYTTALKELPQEVADEIQKRIGARIRELEVAVQRMQEMATEH